MPLPSETFWCTYDTKNQWFSVLLTLCWFVTFQFKKQTMSDAPVLSTFPWNHALLEWNLLPNECIWDWGITSIIPRQDYNYRNRGLFLYVIGQVAVGTECYSMAIMMQKKIHLMAIAIVPCGSQNTTSQTVPWLSYPKVLWWFIIFLGLSDGWNRVLWYISKRALGC